jgi:hypothetical protein
MAKYPKTQIDDPTIKVCRIKVEWNKDDKVFMNRELAKKFHVKRYGDEVKIYQS